LFYGLAEKYAKLEKRAPGDPNPFVSHVDELEKTFQAALARAK
jgi:hypothetical protein